MSASDLSLRTDVTSSWTARQGKALQMQGLRGRGAGLTLHFLKTKHCAANVDMVYGLNYFSWSTMYSSAVQSLLKTKKTACLTTCQSSSPDSKFFPLWGNASRIHMDDFACLCSHHLTSNLTKRPISFYNICSVFAVQSILLEGSQEEERQMEAQYHTVIKQRNTVHGHRWGPDVFLCLCYS